MDRRALIQRYRRAGFRGRVGFGQRPAILVVDFQKGFTDRSLPLGADMGREIAATQKLLAAARGKRLLIVFTRIAYEKNGADGGRYVEKVPTLKALVEGTPLVEIDERLTPRPGEFLLTKKFMSAFFGTNLAALLVGFGIDTVILAGCVTSACIRASATDSMQYGFRTILVRECITDRAPEPHKANLFDLDAKVGDVVSLHQVVRYLNAISLGDGVD